MAERLPLCKKTFQDKLGERCFPQRRACGEWSPFEGNVERRTVSFDFANQTGQIPPGKTLILRPRTMAQTSLMLRPMLVLSTISTKQKKAWPMLLFMKERRGGAEARSGLVIVLNEQDEKCIEQTEFQRGSIAGPLRNFLDEH